MLAKMRRLGAAGLMVATMAVALSACLGGPEGSPGIDRLHLVEKDPFYTMALPAGYRVLSKSAGVPKWDSNGYPLGQPGWNGNPGIDEIFRTAASRTAVVAYFDRRARQAGWAVDARASLPTLGSWAWAKDFQGFTANASISAGEHGKWLFGISAPPIGPTT